MLFNVLFTGKINHILDGIYKGDFGMHTILVST